MAQIGDQKACRLTPTVCREIEYMRKHMISYIPKGKFFSEIDQHAVQTFKGILIET